jgi:hypothetical protein
MAGKERRFDNAIDGSQSISLIFKSKSHYQGKFTWIRHFYGKSA